MNDERFTILVVEDDRPTRRFLVDNLRADGYAPITATTVDEALATANEQYPDLILVDLGLPGRDGLELLEEIRDADGVASRIDPTVPLLVVTGRANELNRLRTFDRGADDVVAKPFSYPELRARIGALLRRSALRARRGRLRVGALEVDPAARTAHLNGRAVPLSQKEFGLLRVLASDPIRVFTKEELLRQVWGYRSIGSTRTLDSHACRLRRKLARDGDAFVVNVWGVGYRLCDAPAAS